MQTLVLQPESYYPCPDAHYTIFLNINIPNISFAYTGTNAQFKNRYRKATATNDQCCGSESERIRFGWIRIRKKVRIRIQTML
jgi:hypothetical protein